MLTARLSAENQCWRRIWRVDIGCFNWARPPFWQVGESEYVDRVANIPPSYVYRFFKGKKNNLLPSPGPRLYHPFLHQISSKMRVLLVPRIQPKYSKKKNFSGDFKSCRAHTDGNVHNVQAASWSSKGITSGGMCECVWMCVCVSPGRFPFIET